MPVDQNAAITITAFDWVPDFAKGLVRDLRVRWALEEVDQNYAVRLLAQGDQNTPEHCALQPFGQVPTYEEGDLTLFESGAIVLHVGEKFGKLLPEDPQARARAVEWAFAALNSVEPFVTDFALTAIFEADQTWSKARVEVVKKRIRGRLNHLADRLGEADWLDGDFSAADLLMVTVLRGLRGTGLVEAHANLAAYQARGEARPAFQRALADHMAGFTGSPPPGWG